MAASVARTKTCADECHSIVGRGSVVQEKFNIIVLVASYGGAAHGKVEVKIVGGGSLPPSLLIF